MRKIIYFLIVSLLLVFSCAKRNNTQVITVNELQPLLKDSIQLLDVRTYQEYASGHIKNALLIDVRATDFEKEATQKLVKDKPVYVYCRLGGRGEKACAILKAKGYTVYNLKGGYTAWNIKN